MRLLALLVVVLLNGVRLLGASAEETAATLAQCREELQPSQPVELRRRATLVAGKYLDTEASELLTQCLQDEDAVVRRNALVSIGEEHFHLRQNRDGVFKCLRDEEVNIRRLASSLLDEALVGTSAERQADMPEEQFISYINAALADEDAEVRRNVLAALENTSLSLDGSVLAPFLQETSTATVILAITPYLMSDAGPEEKCAALMPLATRPEREIRLALAEALENMVLSPLKPLFQTLAKDELPEVRCCALAALLGLTPDDASLWQEMQRLLVDDAVPAESRVKLLEGLRGFPPEQTWPVVEPLLERKQSEQVRVAAWQLLLFQKDLQENLPTGRLAREFAAEPSAAVRRIQLSVLRRRQDGLAAADLSGLLSSSFAEVRRAALSLSAKLPSEQRIELVFNALLDEDETVRVDAVRLIASLRPPEWKQLLCDSLEESSPVISAAAARGLLPVAQNDAAVSAALRNYLPRCTDAALRRQLMERLSRKTPNHPRPQNEQQ